MIKIALVYLTIAIPAIFIGDCTSPLGSSEPTQREGLEINLEVPENVSPGESFEIHYSITNTRTSDVVLRTPHACLVDIGVYKNDDRIPFQGTPLACATVITDHEISAGSTLERRYKLQAATGYPDPQPVPEGTYTIRVKSKVGSINGEPGTLPDIEKEITVE